MSGTIHNYFTPAHFDAFLQSRDEPDWMQQFRKEAYHAFQALRWPSVQDEAWRRTNISHIEFLQYKPLNGVAPDVPMKIADQFDSMSGAIHFRGAHPEKSFIVKPVLQQNVVFMPLPDAIRRFPDLVRQYFMKNRLAPAHGKFEAMHGSFWTHGVLLYVPQFVEVAQPFEVVFEEVGEKRSSYPHLLVVLEKGARVTLHHHIRSTDESELVRNAMMSFHIKEGARLDYTEIQSLNEQSYTFTNGNVHVGRDGSIHSLVAVFGSKLSKHNFSSLLQEPGAHARMDGLYFADHFQHIDMQTLQQHEAPHATSNLLYKGTIRDRARAVYQGMIKVFPDAQLTDAYQTNKNLLLNDQAHADSIPSLEIEANDVKCSHGSTVGKINDEELFYLMSRGLSQAEASRMIIAGFFEEILNRQPTNIRNILAGSIEKELETQKN